MDDEQDTTDDSLTERLRQLDPRVAIAARDLRSLRYEKTIVMALVVQLVIASFSSFLVLGLVSVYSSDTNQTRVGYAGNATEPVVEEMKDEESINALRYVSEDELARGVSTDVVDAGVIVNERSDGKLAVSLIIPREELQTTILVTQLKDVLERVENTERRESGEYLQRTVLSYPDVDVSNPYFTFTYTVLIPLLIFLPIFISGSILVDSITEEIERQTLELLEATPTNLSGIVDAKVAVASLLAPGQAALWLGLLQVNGTQVAHPFVILAFTLALAVLFVSVGTSISLWLRNRQQAQLAYSAVLIVAFAGLSALPQPPSNVVARLAAGSPDGVTYATVAVLLVCALALYGVVRQRVGSVASN